MLEKGRELVSQYIAGQIDSVFTERGFVSNDGARYFRRNDHLIHYFILYTEELSKEMHGSRVDGTHIGFVFGEFLDFVPELNLDNLSHKSPIAFANSINMLAFKEKRHFKKAAEKISAAFEEIDSERFSLVTTSDDYVNYHSRRKPSIEKIFYLTLEGKDEEADAWLHLLNHQYRGFRGSQDYDGGLDIHIQEPDEMESSFHKLETNQRVEYIQQLIKFNIENNDLGFLYEEV